MNRIANPALDKLHDGKLSLGCGLRLARTIDIARTLKHAGSPAKVPSRFALVESLPRNAMGKVTKPDVKRMFESTT